MYEVKTFKNDLDATPTQSEFLLRKRKTYRQI